LRQPLFFSDLSRLLDLGVQYGLLAQTRLLPSPYLNIFYGRCTQKKRCKFIAGNFVQSSGIFKFGKCGRNTFCADVITKNYVFNLLLNTMEDA